MDALNAYFPLKRRSALGSRAIGGTLESGGQFFPINSYSLFYVLFVRGREGGKEGRNCIYHHRGYAGVAGKKDFRCNGV